MRTPDGVEARLRHAEVFHLARLDQVPDRAGDVFDRHSGVDTVLVEQVNDVGFEPLQRRFGDRPDVFRPAVDADRFAFFKLEPELGGDHHLVAHRRKRCANQFLVDPGAVDLRRVEEVDAQFDGRSQQRRHLGDIFRPAVGRTHPHAAETNNRDLEAT